MHPVKNILNRLRWDAQERPENYLITYRHRGAPDDIKRIRASRIMKLGKSYFTIQEAGASDESVIPFHRILEIRNTAVDTVIWVSRKESLGRNS
jgi:uncharacterized protein (UPF0248 family)